MDRTQARTTDASLWQDCHQRDSVDLVSLLGGADILDECPSRTSNEPSA